MNLCGTKRKHETKVEEEEEEEEVEEGGGGRVRRREPPPGTKFIQMSYLGNWVFQGRRGDETWNSIWYTY